MYLSKFKAKYSMLKIDSREYGKGPVNFNLLIAHAIVVIAPAGLVVFLGAIVMAQAQLIAADAEGESFTRKRQCGTANSPLNTEARVKLLQKLHPAIYTEGSMQS